MERTGKSTSTTKIYLLWSGNKARLISHQHHPIVTANFPYGWPLDTTLDALKHGACDTKRMWVDGTYPDITEIMATRAV